LQHRSFADDLSARRPCRIKAQRAINCSTKTFGAPKARHSRQSLGHRPGLRKSENISAESTIHLRLNSMREYANCPKPFSIVCRRALRLRIEARKLNRAFSAWPSGPIEFLGRCPQAKADMAPLALNMHEVGYSSLHTAHHLLNQQALLQRSRPARRAPAAAVP
jgi:hypothetical protein